MTDPAPDGVMVDCSSGSVYCTPLTPEQIAAQQAAAQQAAAQEQAAATAQQQLVSTVAASTDSAVLALGQLMGILPVQPAASTPTGSARAR